MNNIKDLLETMDYSPWDYDETEYGTMSHYQRRVDTVYTEYPVCNSNGMLFINIIHSIMFESGEWFEMTLVHENSSGEWCKLGIYSLTEKDVIDKLADYETILLKMWDVFANAEACG